MSIKGFFTDRFGRVRPITNAEQKPATDGPDPVKSDDNQHITYIDVRKEGFKDGVLEIDKKHFEAWIGHSENLEAVKHKLQTLRSDLNRYMAQLIRTETDGERLQVEIAGNTEKLKHQETLLRLQEEKKQNILKERATLREKLESIKPHYGPVLAFVFLLAGFALLAADYAISHAIVAKAFDMEDGYRSVLFATGMAVMAFAIKPAIDRIFEKNYTGGDNKTKLRNHFFLGTVAVLVLLSLGVLGVFRGQADAGFKLMSAKNNEISSINTDITILAAEKATATRPLQADIDQLNLGLAENRYGQAAYVMLAIVFALAGALCLSLAFPALEGHTKKSGIRFNIGRNKKAEKKLEAVYLNILQTVTDLKSNLEQARTTLTCLPALELLDQKVDNLKTQIQEQVEKYRQINTDTLTASYNDAFEEALAHDVEGKPTIYWKEVPGLIDEPKPEPAIQPNSNDKGATQSWMNRFFGNKNQAVPEQKPVYVHQKLRKLIQERRLN